MGPIKARDRRHSMDSEYSLSTEKPAGPKNKHDLHKLKKHKLHHQNQKETVDVPVPQQNEDQMQTPPEPPSQPANQPTLKPRISSSYPAPYWEEKLAKNVDLFTELEKSDSLKEALAADPRLAEELMKHPDIAWEVARDETLALKVIFRPDLIRELAFARYEMLSELKHGISLPVPGDPNHTHKVSAQRKSLEHKLIQHIPKHKTRLRPGEEEREESSSTSSNSGSILSVESRATLPVDVKPSLATTIQFPPSINYIRECARIFMRHHVEITDGCANCCDEKRESYDVLNTYGQLLYRAYETKGFWPFRPFRLIITEPDDTSLIIMVRKVSLRNMRTVAVYCPESKYIGCVEQSWGLGTPRLTLRNEIGDAMIRIKVLKRPFCSYFRYDPDFVFELRTIGDRNIIGKISPEWLDVPRGVFPSEKIYGVNFPKELSAKVKVIVMAAWFLTYSLCYNGKMARQVRHNLSENEKDLIEYVKEDTDDWRLKYDPSSDSLLSFHQPER